MVSTSAGDGTNDDRGRSSNSEDGVDGLVLARRNPELVPMPVARLPADRHPAKVYLKRLAPGSQPTMRNALQVVAELLTAGRCNWDTMSWHLLRAQHTKALRADLAHRYAPA